MQNPPLKTLGWALVALGTAAGLTVAGTAEAAAAPRGQGTAAPPKDGTARTAAASGHRFYGGAYQYASTLGTAATLTIHQPPVDRASAGPGTDSLASITAQSRDHKQTVQVGWTVDQRLSGDTRPHLFVYRWVDGKASCYNACGFVATSDAVRPGMQLTAGSKRQFAIKHNNGKWYVGYGGTWFGYYPDSIWKGRFTRAGLTQWYGSVAAPGTKPCTDMGNGKWAKNSAAASISGIKFFSGPAVKIAINPVTNARLYTAQRTGATGLRYGGPGAC